jgi:hypothetical protein
VTIYGAAFRVLCARAAICVALAGEDRLAVAQSGKLQRLGAAQDSVRRFPLDQVNG